MCYSTVGLLALILPIINVVRSFAITSSALDYVPIVTVKNGSYSGLRNTHYQQDMFLGMPYAKPPLKSLRFRPPLSLNSSWDGTRAATVYGPHCVGYGPDNIGYPMSEDCLTINVIRPTAAGDSLPVLLWIHGGGLAMGGSADARYNLSFIVQQSVASHTPILAVSINYRVAGWGFLWGDPVRQEGSGNVGLRDQRLAMHWIQDNIAAFGGDPTKVTLWGESSGAISIGTHLLAYGGRDDRLFRGAIMDSGGPAGTQFTNATSIMYGSLVNLTGCSGAVESLDCLRKLPFSTLNKFFNSTSAAVPFKWGLVIDSDIITDIQSTQLKKGQFVNVPILTGTNTDEGTQFGAKGLNTTVEFNRVVQSSGVDNATAEVIDIIYPDIDDVGIPSTFPGPFTPQLGAQYKRSCAYCGDIKMHFPRRLTTLIWAHYNVLAYSYRFNVIVNGVTPAQGVTHFQELAFAMNNARGLGYSPSPFAGEPSSFISLANLMSRMWVSFVANGDPNCSGCKFTI